jgi:hypothetical protein
MKANGTEDRGIDMPGPTALVDHLVTLDVNICELLKRFDAFVQTQQAAPKEDEDDRVRVVTLLADAQHTMTEAVGAVHTTMTDVLAHVQRLTELLSSLVATLPQGRAAKGSGWRQIPRPWLGMLGAVMLAAIAVGWWCWPDTRWSPLALQVDAVLVRQWSSLSKPLQEDLQAIYRARGIRPLAERQAESIAKQKGR